MLTTPYSGINDRTSSSRKECIAVGGAIEESFDRAHALQSHLKAFAYLPRVLKIVDPGPLAPLAGIPVAIKDLIDTVDMPTAYGSPIHEGHLPERDAWIVERLRSLGAHVLGKTVTTEFAWRHPGGTVNPWNANHTPGGSSSGSAAAVAAGIVPLALGTQTLGSVIRPAAFCGTVGYKPTFGSISLRGICPLAESLDHVGLFSRKVSDIALTMSFLTTRDTDNVHHQPLHAFDPSTIVSNRSKPPRIGVLESSLFGDVTAAQAHLMQQVQNRLEDAGAVISHVVLPPVFAEAAANALALTAVEAAEHHRERYPRYGSLMSRPMRELLEQGNAISPQGRAALKTFQRELRELFASWCSDQAIDALMVPPAPGEAPSGLAYTGDPCFCSPITLLGVPAITLPAGFGPHGLPLGVQFVGHAGQDVDLLKLALWCEEQINHAAPVADMSAFLSVR